MKTFRDVSRFHHTLHAQYKPHIAKVQDYTIRTQTRSPLDGTQSLSSSPMLLAAPMSRFHGINRPPASSARNVEDLDNCLTIARTTLCDFQCSPGPRARRRTRDPNRSSQATTSRPPRRHRTQRPSPPPTLRSLLPPMGHQHHQHCLRVAARATERKIRAPTCSRSSSSGCTGRSLKSRPRSSRRTPTMTWTKAWAREFSSRVGRSIQMPRRRSGGSRSMTTKSALPLLKHYQL